MVWFWSLILKLYHKNEDMATKARGWVGILYPDSAPEDWKERIENTHIPALVSPLHDKDKNPDGTLKKPHWHVFLIWESGPTTERNAQRVLTEIGCIELVQPVESVPGMTRYLIHADNPEKAQYSASDVMTFNGANYTEASSSVVTDTKILREIVAFICEKKIRYFSELVKYCEENGEDEWFYIISSKKCFFIKSVIESQEKKFRDEMLELMQQGAYKGRRLDEKADDYEPEEGADDAE